MPRNRHQHGRPDSLQVQVALKIKLPRGVKPSPSLPSKIIDAMVHGEELPPNVEVRGVFWRNPTRKGDLAHWRWHEGADLDKVAGPPDAYGRRFINGVEVESTPRGSLQDAIGSLGGALYSGVITF
jgi:hypothetical protein